MILHNRLVKTFFIWGFIFFCGHAAGQGTWVPLTSHTPFASGGVMILLSDGTVIAKNQHGGFSEGNSWSRLKPDIHGSYIHGTWDTIMPMFDTRTYFSAQVLKDGRVYVAGGEYGTGSPNVELYDPFTNTWTPAPAMTGGDIMQDGNSELLPDGRILQTYFPGGSGLGCKIFDPVSNLYYPAPTSLTSFIESTWLKLPDNSVLFNDYDRFSERYIPSLNAWVVDDSLPASLYGPFNNETGPAFLLPDGRAFFTGSPGTTAYYTPSGTASPGTWAAGPIFPHTQGVPDAAGAMMANGKILLVTSFVPYGPGVYPSPMSFYEFNYVADTFSMLEAPGGGFTIGDACYYANLLDLPDGSVLFNVEGATQYYEYVPDGTPLLAGKPIIDSIIKISCDTYKITGKLFNGITEGASYGDDWQMSTNYPLVRLTSGTNVYYAHSFNWNRTGVMTGALPDTAFFIIPAGVPDGSYGLQVVVNGNPSASRPMATCAMVALHASQENELVPGGIAVYPNPAFENLNIAFHSTAAGQYAVKLLDVFGRTVLQETGRSAVGENKRSIDVRGIPVGIYTILLQEESGVSQAKVTIQ